MKNLQEIMFESYLEDSLILHMSINFDNMSNVLYEHFGEVDIIRCISPEIYKFIEKLKNKIELDCTEINTFFNKLVIIRSNEYGFGYSSGETDFINKIIYIYVNLENINKLDAIDLIEHELTHAYEDFARFNSGKDTFSKLFKRSYSFSKRYLFARDKYFSDCSKLIYFLLTSQERNAYMTKLRSDIHKIISSHNWTTASFDYNVFISELKKEPTWKLYFILGTIVTQLKENTLKDAEEYDKNLASIYNLNNKNYTKSELRNKLYNAWIKFKNKFDNFVPKILTDELLYVNHHTSSVNFSKQNLGKIKILSNE